MVSFSQVPAVKKDTIFDAARKNFNLSYFVTALADDSGVKFHNIFEKTDGFA